ncbi:RNA polymerase sigma-70 factor [Fodinibius salsisoli]|uniref:RNA polymerase sigma-70 factor n=1 Tax=Fodinibius salsisoli TaxID=2820877 RepID=A0ABT3PKN9_9BACT|nr:RNA polymerase sigma-70 factor [Fodinibius salsisoli]MCW9706492.1 RNA polymerase sigma-70 factor [Fodinibius salsisoli]
MGDDIKLWISKIREGDREAFEKLFLRFYDPLCKFAWRYLRSAHISEELVQDVFLTVWESRESLDPEKSIKSYLYKAVKNKALNHLKHKNLAEDYNQQIDWLNSTSISQIHDFNNEDSKFVKAVQKEIDNLPEKARHVYKLSRKDGLTYQEIADILDISKRTVESQISRSLKILRERLAQYFDLHTAS